MREQRPHRRCASAAAQRCRQPPAGPEESLADEQGSLTLARRPGRSLGDEEQKLLREFLLGDARFDTEVEASARKLVRTGGCDNLNFALSTLMDTVWTVLVLTWDAIRDGTLPLMQDASAVLRQDHSSGGEYQEMYEELLYQFNESRAAWLQEISEHRDRHGRGKVGLEQQVEKATSHDVFRFLPKDAILKEHQPYFQAALEESLRMALCADAGVTAKEEHRTIGEKLERLQAELEACQEELQDQKDVNDTLERSLMRKGGATRECWEKTVNQLTEEKAALEAEVTRIPLLENKLRALRITEEEIQSPDELNTEEIQRRWLKAEVERLRQTSAEVARLSKILEEKNSELEKLRGALAAQPPKEQPVAPVGGGGNRKGGLGSEPANGRFQAPAVVEQPQGGGSQEIRRMEKELARQQAALQAEREAVAQQAEELKLQREVLNEREQRLRREPEPSLVPSRSFADIEAATRVSSCTVGTAVIPSSSSSSCSADENATQVATSVAAVMLPPPPPPPQEEPMASSATAASAVSSASASRRPSGASLALPGCDAAVQTDSNLLRRDSDVAARAELAETRHQSEELRRALEDLRRLFEESKAYVEGLGIDAGGLEQALANFDYVEQREQVFIRLWKDAQGRLQRPAKPRCDAAGLVLDASAKEEAGDAECVLARIVTCRPFADDPEPEPMPQASRQRVVSRAAPMAAQSGAPVSAVVGTALDTDAALASGSEVTGSALQAAVRTQRPWTADATSGRRPASGSFANYCRRLREEAGQQAAVDLQPQCQQLQQPQPLKMEHVVSCGTLAPAQAATSEAAEAAGRHFVLQVPHSASQPSLATTAARRRPLSSGGAGSRRVPSQPGQLGQPAGSHRALSQPGQRSLPDVRGPGTAASRSGSVGATRRPPGRNSAAAD